VAAAVPHAGTPAAAAAAHRAGPHLRQLPAAHPACARMWSCREAASGSAWEQQQPVQPHAKLLSSQSFNCTSQQQQKQCQQPYHQQERSLAVGMQSASMHYAPLQPCWSGQQQQYPQQTMLSSQQQQQQFTSFPASLPPLACMPSLLEREQQQQLPQLIETGALLHAACF
jgi:hypothetical protein